MNQIQHDTIKSYLDNDEQAFKDLKQNFTIIADLEKKLYFAYENLVKCLKDIREHKEKLGKIVTIYEEMEKSMIEVQKHKKEYFEFLEMKVVPSLNGQLEQNKGKKQNLMDYITKLNIEKQKEEKNPQAVDDNKQKELYQALENAKKEKIQSAQTLNTQYTIYMNEKNAELKAMFQHLLNNLLMIYAKGLQEYSKMKDKKLKSILIKCQEMLEKDELQIIIQIYLKKLFPNLEAILFTGKYTSLMEIDQCTQLWHSAGFQGPFFVIKCQEIQLIILNQNSTSDFVRVLRKGQKYEFGKQQQWFYFHFQDESQKVYSIWFQEEADFKAFEECIYKIYH